MPRATDTDAPVLLSLREVGRRLGVSEQTVYRLVNSGELAHVKGGYGVRPQRKVREDDLAEFIRRRTEGEDVA